MSRGRGCVWESSKYAAGGQAEKDCLYPVLGQVGAEVGRCAYSYLLRPRDIDTPEVQPEEEVPVRGLGPDDGTVTHGPPCLDSIKEYRYLSKTHRGYLNA